MGEGTLAGPDGSLFFRIAGDEGDGIPLLCLHGGPGFAHDYLEPLSALADERPVVFYDQLGCGGSQRSTDPSLWTTERFVAEVDTVRRALGLGRIHLLGHSWGGYLAIAYSAGGLEGVASLVLASPLVSVPTWLADAGRLRGSLPRAVQDTLTRHEEAGHTDCPEYVAATLAFYKRHLCRLDPWPDALERTWSNASFDVYEEMWGPTEFYATGNLKGTDVSHLLAGIDVPTLFTCGRYDEASPDSTSSFATKVSGARIEVFESSSHTPHLEEAERYVDVLRGFLASVEVAR